ncbi:MAG: phosphatase PAP2 family protein [Sulfuricaulis sp.]
MIKTISLNNRIVLLLAMLIAVFSYFYLDADIARFIQRQLHRSVLLEKTFSNIPDLLLLIVLVITALSWVGYFFIGRRDMNQRFAFFLRACGTVVPLAYLIKDFLQYVFGRPDPYIWLHHHLLLRFYWFSARAGYGCFPSGHMTVFTALLLTMSYYYPRYRRVTLAMLILLALALVITNHHYLSDVITGACLGTVIALIVVDQKYFRLRHDEIH